VASDVLVVRDGVKSFATNRLPLPAAEVRQLYRIRAQIEEGSRVCKAQLGLTGCQARSERAPLHHMICCLVALCVLKQERHDQQLSIYQLKRWLSFRDPAYALPALECLKRTTQLLPPARSWWDARGTGEREANRALLLAAGADEVSMTLRESCTHVRQWGLLDASPTPEGAPPIGLRPYLPDVSPTPLISREA